MNDLISRQAAIDALRTCYDTETVTMDNGDEYINYGDAVGEIEQLPPIQSKLLQPWEVLVAQAVLPQPEQHIDADGTLWVTVTDIEQVTRVIVDEEKSKFCRQFYMDAQPEPCEDDPRADVYYLAEKIGINQLYELVVQLRGEPEPCEDAVSRADILSMIDDMADDVNDGFGFAYEQWKEQAEELPPVTPKQRTGKWERHYSRPNVYADLCWHCSACGYYHADNWTNKFKYCPNCGVKMEGDAE